MQPQNKVGPQSFSSLSGLSFTLTLFPLQVSAQLPKLVTTVNHGPSLWGPFMMSQLLITYLCPLTPISPLCLEHLSPPPGAFISQFPIPPSSCSRPPPFLLLSPRIFLLGVDIWWMVLGPLQRVESKALKSFTSPAAPGLWEDLTAQSRSYYGITLHP